MGLLVGGGEPTYVKLKEVEKLAVRHFKQLAEIADLALAPVTIRTLLCFILRMLITN